MESIESAPQACRAALARAREQQAATAEILRVISRSPSDEQPVFDTIAQAALRLCAATSSTVITFDGGLLRVAALRVTQPGGAAAINALFPRRADEASVAGRAVQAGHVVAIPDTLADKAYALHADAKRQGWRSVLGVPLMCEGQPIGAIAVGRAEPGPFPPSQLALLHTFADQAVIAIQNARLFNETKEALARQTATSDVLRVISRSVTDTQPVFDVIAERAARLTGANSGWVFRFDGEWIHGASAFGLSPQARALALTYFPMRPSGASYTARAIRDGAVVNVADALAEADPEYATKPVARAAGYRSVLSVPMFRGRQVLGAISVNRPEVGRFADKEVELLRTFADQAVIAIENVRLFTELDARNRELSEALEQQTATSEILRVISRSPTDLAPVFAAVAASVARLTDAPDVVILKVEDGRLRYAASVGPFGQTVGPELDLPIDRSSVCGHALVGRETVHVHDLAAVTDESMSAAIALQRRYGQRTMLAVPMLHNAAPLGTIALLRREIRPFTERQIALVQTFADQAVIAIQNAHLFKELGARNREVTEALEQQTATSEILRAISRSPTDVQPVFEAIATAARNLCKSRSANVFTFDGRLIHAAALTILDPDGLAAVRKAFPRPPGRELAAPRAILTRAVVEIRDVREDPDFLEQQVAASANFRSVLAVPLMRNGDPLGAIAIGRPEPGPFPPQQVALLQTFADQAVIAIENVRLFNELQTRTAELTRSVEQLGALAEVGQAVSSTLDLETVLRTIVSRATQLAGMDGGAIYEYDEAREEFRLHAADRLPDELVEALRSAPPPKGEGAIGRLATQREPVAINDIHDESMYHSRVREILLRLGYRSLLAVPLLREEHLLGGLVVNRKRAGEFEPQVVELLKTFATQSALAIQNARLFREIEDKGRQLEIASRHKSAFLANMSHELRTPLNAIIGFTRIVMRRSADRLEPLQYQNLEKILASALNLLSLINAVLDLAKIESGRIEFDTRPLELASMLATCLRTVEPLVRSGVELRLASGAALPTLLADEEKLRQIVVNLLANAAKFTPTGHVELRACEVGGIVEITVADTGIGIAADKLEQIFEEFEQADASGTRSHGGTGLGLAIARRLARLMGGDVGVRSAPGAGSTFTLTLPARHAGAASP